MTELWAIARQHRADLLRWVAETGLAMVGLIALMTGPGLLSGWNHHLHLSAPAGQGGVLAVSVLVACVVAVLAWGSFALRYTVAAKVGAVLLGGSAIVVALSGAVAPGAGAAAAAPAEAVVSVLVLVTLLGFCPVIYLAATGTSCPNPRDRTLPQLGRLTVLPFYLLAYVLAGAGLYVSLGVEDSVLIGGGGALSGISYAIAVLGFAMTGILRSRATSAYAALAALAATALSLPLALAGVLLAATTHHRVTGQVIDLAALLVLIPGLGWLAQHRATTTPLTPATAALEGSA